MQNGAAMSSPHCAADGGDGDGGCVGYVGFSRPLLQGFCSFSGSEGRLFPIVFRKKVLPIFRFLW